jgi:hypothetical protein
LFTRGRQLRGAHGIQVVQPGGASLDLVDAAPDLVGSSGYNFPVAVPVLGLKAPQRLAHGPRPAGSNVFEYPGTAAMIPILDSYERSKPAA